MLQIEAVWYMKVAPKIKKLKFSLIINHLINASKTSLLFYLLHL